MARRGMALCNACGHAAALHQGGSCSICGCSGGRTYTGTPAPLPGRGRGEHEREARAPKRTVSPRTDHLSRDSRALLDFVVNQMTADEARRFGIAVAQRQGVQFDAAYPRGAMRKLVTELTPMTASRYLAELRNRKRAGEPLLRE